MIQQRIIAGSFVVGIFLLYFFGVDFFNAKPERRPADTAVIQSTQKKEIPTNVFLSNELIRFGVYSNGLKVGNGELVYNGVKETGGLKVQNINLKISTFSINDEEDVLGSLDFSSPVKVDRTLRIFGKLEAISEIYSLGKKSVSITKRVNNSAPQTQVLRSEEELGNVLLLIYRLRNDGSMKEGKVYKITLPTQKFELIVRDKRKVRVPLGTFEAFYLESEPAKYKIWLSNDSNKTPVRIQGLLPMGMIYLAATSVEVSSL